MNTEDKITLTISRDQSLLLGAAISLMPNNDQVTRMLKDKTLKEDSPEALIVTTLLMFSTAIDEGEKKKLKDSLVLGRDYTNPEFQK